MEIYENGKIREATPEEVAEAMREKEAAEKVIVQLSVAEVLQILAPKLFQDVPDKTALAMVDYFPKWEDKIGEQAIAGERLWYDGFLWKVLQPHTVQDNWTPSTSPSLFVKVSIEEWPEWVQPTGAQDAYNKGDKVTYEGEHWVSIIDANVYAPGVYGWEKV